ncbi:MAG TPA: DUF721 domain-containing protein [Pyrinomonadaceae bacterium]|nr:DUF721 domain-containing protein [Pyrinomonadaceae bacterium]
MIDLTALLPKLLRANGANAELAVKLAWSKAAGAGLRRQTIPVRLVSKTLIVAVADPIWQKQLQHMSAELIFRINNLLQGSLIDAIEFRVDADALKSNRPTDTASVKETKNQPAPTELLFAASAIADEELRARFVRAAQNCIERRDARDAN